MSRAALSEPARQAARRRPAHAAPARRSRATGAHAVTRGTLAVAALPKERTTPSRGRHLRPVAPARRSARQVRRTRLLVLLTLVVLSVAVAFALVYLHVVAAQRQFTLDRLTNQVSTQQQRYERLRLRVAQLEAPARIISVAEGQYGMTEPQSVTYLEPAGSPPSQTPPAPPSKPSGSTAPAGDANWPKIKSLLKGTP